MIAIIYKHIHNTILEDDDYDDDDVDDAEM